MLPASTINFWGIFGNIIKVIIYKGNFIIRAKQEYSLIVLIIIAYRLRDYIIENRVKYSEVYNRIIAIVILAKYK